VAGSTQNAINFCSFVYIAKSYVYIIEWKSTFLAGKAGLLEFRINSSMVYL
jgi:hypothetical protein